MLAERGINVSYETVRHWTLKFRPAMVMSEELGLRSPELAPTLPERQNATPSNGSVRAMSLRPTLPPPTLPK